MKISAVSLFVLFSIFVQGQQATLSKTVQKYVRELKDLLSKKQDDIRERNRQIADGVFYNATFKRSEQTAAVIRTALKVHGLPVPPVPDVKADLEKEMVK